MPVKPLKVRKCSYCREPGHDRRTCPPLKLDKSKAAETNRNFIELVVNDMVERGISPGALIEFGMPDKETDDNTPLAMITELHWEGLFYRKPGRRWVSISLLTSSPGYHLDHIRRIRFPQHELVRNFDSSLGSYTYDPTSLKGVKDKTNRSSYAPYLSSGDWQVVSPVSVTREKLISSQPLVFFSGWHGIDDYFLDLNIDSCRAGSYYLERRKRRASL
jgi:hypothetical protein